MISNKTETTAIDLDLAPDPEDSARMANLEKSLLDAEPEIPGYKLKPCSAGAMAVLQRQNIKVIYGDTSSMLYDAAAYVLICNADPELSKKARRAAFGDFQEFVLSWLDEQGPAAHAALTEAAPAIADSLSSYWAALTKSAETKASSSGNAGGRTG